MADPIFGQEVYDSALQHLKESFGHAELRGIQEDVLKNILIRGKNTLALAPTGGGKSLLYQLPALVLPGLSIVISPLISLHKDQEDSMKRLNLPMASLNSSLSDEDMQKVTADIKDGTLKLLIAAPERMDLPSFRWLLRNVNISLLAIDEAHCVSEYGSSFRPDYFKIARFGQEVGAKVTLCLTATASNQVVADICHRFDIEAQDSVFRSATFRPNLALRVRHATNYEDKLSEFADFI
jgi:superfamily II DNA helicase RecQ